MKGLDKKPRRAARAPRAAAVASSATAAELPPVQPVANPVRGEHELPLAGVVYRLRPSRGAINAIEARTGKSMIQLITLGDAGALSLVQLAIITRELVHAGAEDDVTRMITVDRFEDLIFEHGVGRPTSRLTMCLLDAANGGRTSAGNVKAAAG